MDQSLQLIYVKDEEREKHIQRECFEGARSAYVFKFPWVIQYTLND